MCGERLFATVAAHQFTQTHEKLWKKDCSNQQMTNKVKGKSLRHIQTPAQRQRGQVQSFQRGKEYPPTVIK